MTVNSNRGKGIGTPFNRRSIREKTANTKCYQIPLGQHFKKYSKLYQRLGTVKWPLLKGWYTRKPWFSSILRISQRFFNISSWNIFWYQDLIEYLWWILNVWLWYYFLDTLERSIKVTISISRFHDFCSRLYAPTRDVQVQALSVLEN